MSNYEKNTFSNYYISRSKPHHDPIYKYKTTYNCKRGGRIFKSSSTGLREKRSFKQGCNSKICVRKILYDNEIPKISQNLPTIAASSCIAETINTGDSSPIAETNILVNTGDSSPIAKTSQILEVISDSSCIPRISRLISDKNSLVLQEWDKNIMKNIRMLIKYKRGSIHKRPKKMQKKNFSQAN
ncbi:unnamed protein product [Gordionus sp. m RMFG-2023]